MDASPASFSAGHCADAVVHATPSLSGFFPEPCPVSELSGSRQGSGIIILMCLYSKCFLLFLPFYVRKQLFRIIRSSLLHNRIDDSQKLAVNHDQRLHPFERIPYFYLPSYTSHNLFCSAPILNISCKSLAIASTLASICSTVPVLLPALICHTTKPGMNPAPNVNICFIQKTENILNTGTTMIAILSLLWNNLILIVHHTVADIHVYLC